MKNKFIFYLLSFTWGLPMTLLGCLATAVLMIAGKKPKMYGWCWYFEIGEKWGGLSLGPVLLVYKDASDRIKIHEVGHAVQNIRYGLLMPFLVGIPSMIRYWYRAFRNYIARPCTTGYYDIWFEAEADRLGTKLMVGIPAIFVDVMYRKYGIR